MPEFFAGHNNFWNRVYEALVRPISVPKHICHARNMVLRVAQSTTGNEQRD